jgi:hypothetical protein
MQGPSWIALFERIPAKLHDSLALTLATGNEILMQSVLRLESDFAIMRGRMSGSTDAGRVLIVPYDQILNLAFTKRMLEPEVRAIFGDILTAPTAAADAGAAVEEAAAETPAPDAASVDVNKAQGPLAAVPAQPTPGSCPSASAAKHAPPSKSILLARLRAKLAEQGK